MLTTRNSPTPTETVMMSTVVSMCGTLPASTVRSGSATVMATPRTKLSERMSGRLRVLVIFAPRWLPMGVMEESDPRVKRPMPAMSITEPSTKASIRSAETGTRNRQSTATMRMMGSVEATASCSFSRSAVLTVNGITPGQKNVCLYSILTETAAQVK